MTAKEITSRIEKEINGVWDMTNAHHVDLRQSLVAPIAIRVIHRLVARGKVRKTLMPVWLVLEEKPGQRDGYRIVFDERPHCFGLATEGFADDEHLCLCGLYGDFITTFKGM